MTKKLYLEDTYQFCFEAYVQNLGKDEKGMFIIFDQTCFYPQGGGQASDQGIIENDQLKIKVFHVSHSESEVKHYILFSEANIAVGSKFYCSIDQERRLINARYHTSSHLLGNIVELLYPALNPVKAHSFPGEAYVEFQGNETINLDVIQGKIDKKIAEKVKTKIFEIDPVIFNRDFYKLPYNVPENKKFRVMQIGEMAPVPCGGTHLSFVNEIGNMKITKAKAKNNYLRISYEVT